MTQDYIYMLALKLDAKGKHNLAKIARLYASCRRLDRFQAAYVRKLATMAR